MKGLASFLFTLSIISLHLEAQLSAPGFLENGGQWDENVHAAAPKAQVGLVDASRVPRAVFHAHAHDVEHDRQQDTMQSGVGAVAQLRDRQELK